MRKLQELQLNYSIVTSDSINILDDFLKISNILFNLQFNKTSFDENSLSSLYKSLSNYKKFDFLKSILSDIKKALKEINNNGQESNKSKIDSLCNSITKKTKVVEISLLKGNFDSMPSIDIVSEFNQLQQLLKTSSQIIIQAVNVNFLKNGLDFIFNAGNKIGFLDSFEKKDWMKINELVFNKQNIYFNYLPELNYNGTFESYIYYIQKIKTDKNEPINLSNIEFHDYIKLLYNMNEDFKKFKKLVDNYLHSNNKTLIKDILSFLENFLLSIKKMRKVNIV